MDIDIDLLHGYVHPEEGDRTPSSGEQTLICLLDSVRERTSIDHASVRNEMHSAARAVFRGCRHDAHDGHRCVVRLTSVVERDQRAREVGPVDGRDRVEQRAAGRRERAAAVRREAEGDLRMGQSERGHRARQRPTLGTLAAQEGASGRQRGEEISHLDAGSRRCTGAAAISGATVAVARDRRRRLIGRPRDQIDVGRRHDRSQRLAAKTQRPDRKEVLRGAQLRRRVALEGVGDLLRRDAVAVVAHSQQIDAAALRVDLDRACPGIDRVLDQLLEHRRRPLDDLAGSDARGDLRRQHADQRSLLPRGNVRHALALKRQALASLLAQVVEPLQRLERRQRVRVQLRELIDQPVARGRRCLRRGPHIAEQRQLRAFPTDLARRTGLQLQQ